MALHTVFALLTLLSSEISAWLIWGMVQSHGVQNVALAFVAGAILVLIMLSCIGM